MNRRTATALALVGISVSLVAQGPRRDGKWEVTTQMSMEGMPAGMPPTTMTQCITKEDAADPQKAVPQPPAGRGGQAPSDCKMSDYKTEGSKVTYTMTCSSPQQVVMKGEVVYGADKFDGTTTMNVAMGRGGQPMNMTMKMTGKRLGDCVK